LAKPLDSNNFVPNSVISVFPCIQLPALRNGHIFILKATTARQSTTMDTSPFTGYRQVDSFSPDEDYLSEEEEVYVTLDLGIVEPTLLSSSSTYRLVVSTGLCPL
jgi:hypothetical protein